VKADGVGSRSHGDRARPVLLPPDPVKPGTTTVRLPLGGVASTDAGQVREPLVRPFWLLAAGLGITILFFLWLRVSLF
jgi:hypothetical protein